MARIGVLFGGVSPEHDISILTGLQVTRALSSTQDEVVALYWAKTGEFYQTRDSLEASDFAQGVPSGSKPLAFNLESGFTLAQSGRFSKPKELELELIINCLHGGPGEDGSIQALFDLAGISYSGPASVAAAVGMDKLAFGGLLLTSGLPSLPRQLLLEGSSAPAYKGPYILKPRYGGSSIGIDVVADYDTALARLKSNVHLRRGAVIEPYRADLFDIQVAVRSYPKLELSAIEKPVRSGPASEILSYREKYVGGQGMVAAPRELPADISEVLADEVKRLALVVAELLPVRGIARIDFLSDGSGELYVNEVNTIPGSLSKYLFVSPPISFESLLADMIRETRTSVTYSPVTDGADGSALRNAGSIAAKLA